MKSTVLLFCAGCVAASCQRAQQPAIGETIQTGSGQPAVTLGFAPMGGGPALSDHDQAFVRSALAIGMGEVELATEVRARSRNQDVRQLATDIIDDFNHIDAEMTKLADAHAVSLPATVAPQLDVARRTVLSDPVNLDRRYVDEVIASYGDLLDRYGEASRTAADQDLKKIAGPAAQTLQTHVRRAEMIRDALASSP